MFLSLVSGSSGNASLFEYNGTTILVDIGMSCKKLCEALDSIDISPDKINAVLITHEHSDHIKGLGVFMRKFNKPVFATNGTLDKFNFGKVDESLINVFESGKAFSIGDIEINSFPISHDANNPVGFTFNTGNEKYSIATDTGIVTDKVFNAVKGSKAVLLEANHDVEMLKYGGYPYELKKRILGEKGHLSNDTAAITANKLVKYGTEYIMLAHLSDKNNLPGIAYKTTENYLKKNGIKPGQDVKLSVASRYEVTKFI